MQQQAGEKKEAEIGTVHATCGLAWANRCHHMTDRVEWSCVQWSGVVTSDCCMQHLRYSTPLNAEGKLFGIAIFDLISKWPLRSFCWGNTYRSCKWNLLLRWAVSLIVDEVRGGKRARGQLATG